MALLFLSLHRHTNMHISKSLTWCSFTSQDLGMCSLNIRIICYITTVPVFRLSCSVVSDSLWPHGLEPARLLCPWNFLGKNTGVGCHFLLQGIFPTQGSNLHLLHWQAGSLPLAPPGKPSSPIGELFLFTAAATAKLLQLCPTLWDPIDGSPPGSSIPGILQARTLEWVAISFSNAGKWKVKGKSLSRVRLFVTPWTAAYQAPLPMGFSRQEYWSGVPLPSPMLD